MKTIIWLLVFLLPFFNFFIAPNISFSDIGLIIGCLGLFFYNKTSIFLNGKNNNLLIYLFGWFILSSFLLLLNPENNYINFTGIIKNGIRFLLIIYFFNNFRFIFRNNYLLNYLFKVWEKVIFFICFLAFIEYSLQFFGIYYSYYFEGITTTTGRSLKESFRISSIFNEPSYLVIYLNFSLLVISEFYSQYKHRSKINYKILLIVIFIVIIIARSLVGFILLTFVLTIYNHTIFGNRVKKNKFKFFLIFLIFSGLTIILNQDRIQAVTNLEDGSANHRLLGSIEISNKIIENDFYLTGVGLGQQKLFLEKKQFSFYDHFFMKGFSRSSGINNMFILIFIQIGIIGLFLYLLFLYRTFKLQKKIFLFFIVSGFGWAYTFNPLYWFSISILTLLINGRKKNLIHLN